MCACGWGSDEGPSHDEVQFYWTERHYSRGSVATVVSARSSGSSYLNRVELQNGCMALARANLFIPSTLCGSNIDPNSGKLNQDVYTRNMTTAMDIYTSRVDQCPVARPKSTFVKVLILLTSKRDDHIFSLSPSTSHTCCSIWSMHSIQFQSDSHST